ncbi:MULTISPECIES: sugar-phosphatase [Vibrio]|uniref:Sugar-phosphatase n=1 Tax=Vibrio casei TaxID=673372 RepID=A0A368LHU5_9VIBR|nr:MULTISPECIES: sugar-phosphatase [Vibrio]RCS70314.1 sugar-phosphatase [Vibrio casei]SJN19887.1 Predicted hydrolase [Vibrio casei]HBV76964.1 Cof-type HAD-IIB family hydrolase [Vibrio sp.]
MYKLIAIDMDGTLLNSDHRITEENKQAIAAARAKGIHIVLASGRPLDGMLTALQELDMDSDEDFVISYNGSMVQKVASKTAIRQEILTGSDAKLIAEWAKKLNVSVHAFSIKEGLITPKNNKYTAHECNINGITLTEMSFEDLEDNDAILKAMMVEEEAELSQAINDLPTDLYNQFTIVRSAPFFLEFMHKTSDKGAGVQALAEHLGINASEVITMGDAGNDHHMLKYAGLGIAMGNATEETKAIADYITDTNNNSGVARAIEKFVLS